MKVFFTVEHLVENVDNDDCDLFMKYFHYLLYVRYMLWCIYIGMKDSYKTSNRPQFEDQKGVIKGVIVKERWHPRE